MGRVIQPSKGQGSIDKSKMLRVAVVSCLVLLVLEQQPTVAVPHPFARPAKNCQLVRSTTDRGECFLEPECNQVCKTVNEQQCSTVNKQQCSTVNERKCNTVNERKCNTVNEQKCSTVNEQQCSTVNEQQCSTVNEQQYSTVNEQQQEQQCST